MARRTLDAYLPRPTVRAASLIGVAAAALAGAAVLVNTRARKAERRYPPLGTFVTSNGVRLHVVERGSGQPVVFLHGNGAMVNDIAISGLLSRAGQSHRAIAFDRPGFGYSDRPRGKNWGPSEQAALLPTAFALMGIERPIVVGHSWGTLVALTLALQHPDCVSGLVLASGYYFPTARADSALMLPVTLPLLGDAINYTVSPLVGEMMIPGMTKAMFAPEAIAARFERDFPVLLTLRPSQIRAYCEDATGMRQGAKELAPHYRSLQCPVTIVAGDCDQIVDHEQAARLHQHIAGSRLEIIKGAGHMVHYAHLDRVVAAIRDVAAGPDGTKAAHEAVVSAAR
jgi:pimeloyl-ACP methyl ester carboxylesterase